jgi:sarcosine oxidase subunit alpha
MDVMRIEKGHSAGAEINGQRTAQSLGLGRMINKSKDSIGNVMSDRDAFNDPNASVLVGLKQLGCDAPLVGGSYLLKLNDALIEQADQGHVTSVAYSPNLKCTIGLGFLKNGADRMGERMRAVNPLQGQDVEVEITSPVFIDPEGERLRA